MRSALYESQASASPLKNFLCMSKGSCAHHCHDASKASRLPLSEAQKPTGRFSCFPLKNKYWYQRFEFPTPTPHPRSSNEFPDPSPRSRLCPLFGPLLTENTPWTIPLRYPKTEKPHWRWQVQHRRSSGEISLAGRVLWLKALVSPTPNDRPSGLAQGQ